MHGVGLLPRGTEALHAIQLPAIVDGDADQLQRVGCHVERVLLRVLLGMGAQGSEGIAALVVEVAVLAEELGTLHGIGQVHATEGLAELARAVIVDRVPRQALRPREDGRAFEEDPDVAPYIIDAAPRLDAARVGLDERGPLVAPDLRAGIVVEMLRGERRALADELDVVAELRIVRRGEELPVVRGQRILGIGDGSTLEVVGDVGHAVVVEAVGVEVGGLIRQVHVVAQLRQPRDAVVVEVARVHIDRVALHHVHLAEGLEGLRLLIDVGAVAGHAGIAVPEDDAALEPLHPRLQRGVVAEQIGVLDVDTATLSFGSSLAAVG